MDISETTAPRSDQQNFDDYIGGPKTVVISEVKQGTTEQPVEIHLVEFPGRPFKPSKSMRRVLVAAWGADSTAYVGRAMTLYGDPTVKFGGSVVGGIRIGQLSHIDKPLTVSLTTTRGKRAPFKVEPLAVPAPAADKTTGEAIPEDVLANVARAKNDGNLPAYLDYLIENEAPAHIINYVKEQK